MPWALEVAQCFGLRGASFFTQSCAVIAIYYHFYEGNLKVPPGSVTISLPSMPLLETNDLPSFIGDVGSYQGLLSVIINQFSNFKKADWLFFNTFDKLEEKVCSLWHPKKQLHRSLNGLENLKPFSSYYVLTMLLSMLRTFHQLDSELDGKSMAYYDNRANNSINLFGQEIGE